jgi:hypothetical protein
MKPPSRGRKETSNELLLVMVAYRLHACTTHDSEMGDTILWAKQQSA